jgi:2-polyprenyl-3-methyl-5-hydroxy-6-metoxy-1,4-benzoquinol methylase
MTLRPCPLCNSQDSQRVRTIVARESGDVIQCRCCSMLYTDIESQETAWDTAPDYLSVYVENRERFADSESATARYALRQLRPGRILEIGLGVGALAREASRQGFEYWCVEPFQPLVELAVDSGCIQRDHAMNAPIEQAELPDASFDSIVALMVLEHVMEPLVAFEQCFRALKPGGVLYVEVPNSRLFRGRVALRRCLGMSDFMEGHINFFTPRTLESAIQRAGIAETSTRVIGSARRGDAQLTIDYYTKARAQLRMLYGCLTILPIDQWLGVASVLACRGVKNEAEPSE